MGRGFTKEPGVELTGAGTSECNGWYRRLEGTPKRWQHGLADSDSRYWFTNETNFPANGYWYENNNGYHLYFGQEARLCTGRIFNTEGYACYYTQTGMNSWQTRRTLGPDRGELSRILQPRAEARCYLDYLRPWGPTGTPNQSSNGRTSSAPGSTQRCQDRQSASWNELLRPPFTVFS